MLTLRHPDTALVRKHLEGQADLGFSYHPVGATRQAKHGVVEGLPSEFVVDHNRVKLGNGQATFEGAKQALRAWETFHVGWVEFCWPNSKVEVGATVGIMTRIGPIWSLNACRIVYLLEDSQRELEGDIDRYGFGYGTLPDHAESGEERFLLEHHQADDSVWYDLLAFSKPGGLLTRIGYRYARRLQQKFARDSLRAMCRACR